MNGHHICALRPFSITHLPALECGCNRHPWVIHRLDKADTKDTGTVFPNSLEISWNQPSKPF
jgi:hypothetical protein